MSSNTAISPNSVVLKPSSILGFPRPLTEVVKKVLQISNPHKDPVAFKVKTTAPKQYCVRPNSGRIEPGQTIEVQVLLQPLKEEPPINAKCRDKFLIQSTRLTSDLAQLAPLAIWPYLETHNKAAIAEVKIRCAYVDPSDPAAENPPPVTEAVTKEPTVATASPATAPARSSGFSIQLAILVAILIFLASWFFL